MNTAQVFLALNIANHELTLSQKPNSAQAIADAAVAVEAVFLENDQLRRRVRELEVETTRRAQEQSDLRAELEANAKLLEAAHERAVVSDFRKLAIANAARQQEWDPDNKVTLAYRGNELAGETGEACNVLKKIERERLGIRGSRATKEQAAEELADVIICATLVANDLAIDLWPAVIAKFNKTSEQYGLTTKLNPGVTREHLPRE